MDSKKLEKIRNRVRKLREEEGVAQMDDTLEGQDAAPADDMAAAPEAPPPAPQPVPATPTNPLVPPQPGMIPTGWAFPADIPMAGAMQTGDVNMAMAQQPAPVVGGQPVTEEEAQMVLEYRKWTKAKKLESLKNKLAARVKENEDEPEDAEDEEDSKKAEMNEKKDKNTMMKKAVSKKIKEELDDEIPAMVPENVELAEPPIEDEDMEMHAEEGAEMEISDEEVIDRLGDITSEINALFADATGEEPEVGEEEEEEEEEEDGEEGFETEEEDEEMGMEEKKLRVAAIREKIAAAKAKKERIAKIKERIAKIRKERAMKEKGESVNISFPAGTKAPVVTPRAVEAVLNTNEDLVESMKKRAAARRRFLASLSRKSEADETPPLDEQPEIEDMMAPDLRAEGEQMEVEDIAKRPESMTDSKKKPASKIVQESLSRPEKTLQKYTERQELDFKKLLSEGFLG